MELNHLKTESFLNQYQEHFPLIKKFLETLLADIKQSNYFQTRIPEDEWTQHLFIKKGQKLIREIAISNGLDTNEEGVKKLLRKAEAANTQLNLLNRLTQNFERVLIIMEMVVHGHPLWLELEQKLRCKMDIKGNQICEHLAKQMKALDANNRDFQEEIDNWKKEATMVFDFPETALLAIKKAKENKLI
jgi:hypothetical protein